MGLPALFLTHFYKIKLKGKTAEMLVHTAKAIYISYVVIVRLSFT